MRVCVWGGSDRDQSAHLCAVGGHSGRRVDAGVSEVKGGEGGRQTLGVTSQDTGKPGSSYVEVCTLPPLLLLSPAVAKCIVGHLAVSCPQVTFDDDLVKWEEADHF